MVVVILVYNTDSNNNVTCRYDESEGICVQMKQ